MQRLSVQDLPAELARLATTGPAPLLLDVREPWETALARLELPHAALKCLPMREIPSRLAELDPQRPILCLCHHGMRSLQVAMFLESHGYPHAYNIEGGIDAWSRDVDPAVPRY
ncbi:rhodanese-like domain-containing protein [Sphaerotilus microaerophilus]|uniref:Rhodanese-like domain-containing protein n=1 Tax=Sphaerotilus microaerophilus TaxID=2914710 RepID=A0ABM7YLH1_9BURK|nr:rhodanese-like domain-containing protein [Sphaerotilus sp. FB-5]BDI05225.1 rhodanese-like domain-containing protein [Sphaerotilus sp. FB-5]